jgi:cytochrome P450
MSTPRYPFHRNAGTGLPNTLRRLVGQPPTQVRLWDNTLAWLVTSHHAARAVLRDRRCSADITRPGYPILAPGRSALTARPTFLRMDDPAHARLRRMVLPHFTARRIAILKPELRRLADTLAAPIAATGPAVDIVPTLTAALPTHAIGTLLGIPEPDMPFISTVTDVLGSHLSPPHAKADAAHRLLAYLRDQVRSQVQHPDHRTPHRRGGRRHPAPARDRRTRNHRRNAVPRRAHHRPTTRPA